MLAYAEVPPTGPRSRIQTGRSSSARRGSSALWPNAVTPSPPSSALVSTVTATFGMVRCSGLRTRMRIVVASAIDCRAGNEASATSTR